MKFEQHFLDDIRHRLPISQVVGEHVIWDKRKTRVAAGDYWACCPFHGEKSPSFHADDRRGIYKCFSCGAAGDHFKFMTEKVGYSFPDAVERLAGMAGLSMPEGQRRDESAESRSAREAKVAADRERVEREQAKRDAEAQESEADRIAKANRMWKSAGRLKGSQGDVYLQSRWCLPVEQWPWDPHEAVRFHKGLPYILDRSLGNFPAIVCRVQDAWGETIAVWLIYLDREKPAKAPVPNPKVGYGPAGGGAVRIGGDGSGRTGGAEGLETSLAIWHLVRAQYPVWAMLSTSGVINWEPPMFVRRHTQFPDGDLGRIDKKTQAIMQPPGIEAARKQHDRLVPTGIHHTISDMCLHGDGVDLLKTLRQHEEFTFDPI